MAPKELASQFDLRRLTSEFSSYRHGSILYMYLENFVTYDEVEIYPGAHMNMVMGPNGSGKSSLVAAMAIGLGWHPSVLGRSKDVSEFIKYNTDRAIIETALRIEPEIATMQYSEDMGDGDHGHQDFDWSLFEMDKRPELGYVVIRRELVRGAHGTDEEGGRTGTRKGSSHSSEWRLNGKVTQYRHIQALVQWLNIQCQNLCQFLPQDKVSEFARMTPVDLLKETEKAAAAPGILEKHEKLIQFQNVLSEERGHLESAEKSLDSLQKQAAILQQVVDRHQSYEEHLQMIKNLEAKRPWLQYNAARDVYLSSRDARDVAKKNLDAALVNVEPLREREKELTVLTKQYEKTRQQTQTKLERKRKVVEDLVIRGDQGVGQRIQEKRQEFHQLRGTRAKRQQAIEEKRREIRGLETVVATNVDDVNARLGEIRAQVVELGRRIGTAEQEKFTEESKKRMIEREAQNLSVDAEAAEAQLRSFEDVKMRRMNVLQRKSAPTASAANWLMQHREEFPNVLGPVALEISASNPSMSTVIENTLGMSNLHSFVSTNNDESERFLDRIQREFGRGVNMIVVDEQAARRSLENRPELHPDLRAAGLEGFSYDFLSGPEIIKLALIDTAKITSIPISSGPLRRPIDSLSSQALSGIKKLATPELRYEISVSRYSNDRSIRSNGLRPAEFFNCSVDEQTKDAAMKRLEEIRRRQRDCQERMRNALAQLQPLEDRVQTMNTEKATLDKTKSALEKQIREHSVSQRRLENSKQQLKDMVEGLAQLTEDPIKTELVNLFRERKQFAISAAAALQDYKNLFAEVIDGQLVDSLNTSELGRVRAQIEEQESRQEHLKLACQEAERIFVNAKNEAKALLEKANRAPISDELKRVFAELPETLAELDVRIAQEQARADLLQGASGAGHSARTQLITLQNEILEIERTVAKKRQSIASCQKEMALVHEVWYRAVSAMVGRINENFNRFFSHLSCLGEVQLIEHGQEYAKWEIAILVRFRDEEQLQRLSAQRQSGGEKSVATILYLLALQELSKSPFRVVDEINQGMDANNERKVHGLIVDTATTAQNRSQYFLITPKLLTDLSYHENMHVLCVYNGEGMPVPETWRDLPDKHSDPRAVVAF